MKLFRSLNSYYYFDLFFLALFFFSVSLQFQASHFFNTQMAATTATIPVRSDRLSAGSSFPRPPPVRSLVKPILTEPWPLRRRWRHASTRSVGPVQASSRADDSAPFEMSVENALKLLGVSEGASFDDILRAKNSIVASCKDDQETISQVEAAYDMLLMQRLTQRRAGKVVSSSVRYADVKRAQSQANSSMPQWMQSTMKKAPVSIESPSTSDLGLQAGVYGALMGLTYFSGSSSPPAGYAGADVPGLILAGSFGASLYFMTKKNVKLGKAVVITIGGLVAGAVVGSVVENWLQVDIVPFLGIRSPAAVVSEVIIISQFLVSLYLR